MTFPTTHFEKLQAVLRNDKLPASDKSRIDGVLERYSKWKSDLDSTRQRAGRIATLEQGHAFIAEMTNLLTTYKSFVDLDLIFDSDNDFLYRQKGQLKIDNSIIEEFLPHLVYPFLPESVSSQVNLGPRGCFSSLSFQGGLTRPVAGGGMQVRAKDQDFTISRDIYLKSSYNPDFTESAEQKTCIAYVAAEIKTNLDKTMFQEACATAHDVKTAITGARYFLVCEWLDMTPLSTAATDIDEVLILRGRRLGSQYRQFYASAEGRRTRREKYSQHLTGNPIRSDVLTRLIGHVIGIFTNQDPAEDEVLQRGFF